MGGHRSVGDGRYNLAKGLGPKVAGGKYAGEIGFGRFIRHYVSGGIQKNLFGKGIGHGDPTNADKETVNGNGLAIPGFYVRNGNLTEASFPMKRGYGAVP